MGSGGGAGGERVNDTRSRAFYRALLRVLPPGVREQRGAGMERVFLEMRAGWIEERGGAGFAFWVATIADVARVAGPEWFEWMTDVGRSETAMTMGEHMRAFWGDVRFAVRQLVRQPMYALTVVVLMSV